MTPLGTRPLTFVLGVILLGLGSVSLGGCDGAGSKRASLYQRLKEGGPWMVERLTNGINYTSQLETRYPEGVRLRFRGGDAGRTYTIEALRSGDSTEVLAEGIVVLPGENVLRMESGFGQFGPVSWTYDFEASRAVFSLQFGSRAFLRTLLSAGRRDENLKLELAPIDE